MTRRSSTTWNRALAVAAILVSAALPPLRAWLMSDVGERCEFDGAPIDDRYQVVLELGGGAEVKCCGLCCAESWLKGSGARAMAVWVADENSGELISAQKAEFVESQVPSNPVARDYRHVFAVSKRADEHLRTFRGRKLTGADRPFAQRR